MADNHGNGVALPSIILGAVCGDVLGSRYEHHNIKHIPTYAALLLGFNRFTDDTVMTCAVADGLLNAFRRFPRHPGYSAELCRELSSSVRDSMVRFGRAYPNAGYGGRFRAWLRSDNPQPYNSWGNGSAMRASFAGWFADSLEEAEHIAALTAAVTHNHPDGIAGAKVTAGAIFLLREGKGKTEVREYAERYYRVDFSLDDIRADYRFDVSCAGSVPQAIVAFLEGEDFVDVVARAISIGGDSDTIAAIAASIAEVIYPIPEEVMGTVLGCLDAALIRVLTETTEFLRSR